MTARLLLLRHGRTAWNLEGRAQGQADVPLDEVGLAQATAVAPYLAGLDPALLHCSDLLRARQTVAPLAELTGLPVRFDARLREYDVGGRQGLTMAEAAERWPDMRPGEGPDDLPTGVPGSEPAEAVAARMVPAVREALDAVPPGRLGIVVAHGAALKLGLVGVLGWPAGTALTLSGLHNCHWATLRRDDDGRVRLEEYGVTAPGLAEPAGDALWVPDFASADRSR